MEMVFSTVLCILGILLFFLGCQSGRGHFLVCLMKLELVALVILGSVEDSYGFIMFILVIVVVEGAVGLSLLVLLSRSTGTDRVSLGALISQLKWNRLNDFKSA